MNLSISDVKLADIAAAGADGVFCGRKSVAAVGTYEPVLKQVVATHEDRGAHIVASSKDYKQIMLDVIIARTDNLKSQPDKYVKLLRGIYGRSTISTRIKRRQFRLSPSISA